jgi:Glyoxalase-like domain
MNPRFDHFLTFANTENIDDYVDKYRALGFVVSDKTHRYKPGLRNRFVLLGCEYLELVWVENEDEFATGGSEEFSRMYNDLPTLRTAARPFSIGFNSPDVEALHQEWTQRGYKIPPVWSFAPPGMPPIFSFQEIPENLLPEINCFAITYHTGSTTQAQSVQQATNTTYAVEGITFVSKAPEEAARRWQTLLSPDIAITADQNVFSVMVTPHTAWWMSPKVFQERYGIVWTPTPHHWGHLAAIHILAENLDLARSILAPRVVPRIAHNRREDFLLVSPTGEDGMIFIIREYPIELWRSERSSVTGEQIVVS